MLPPTTSPSVGGSIGAPRQVPPQETPEALAKTIIEQSVVGKSRDIGKIDQRLAQLATTDPARAVAVHKAVEAKLAPTEAGELRRAIDHRAAVVAGKPEILTRPDGTKTDGFGVRVSGSEPAYEPEKWNKGERSAEQLHNNCYAYAVNDLSLTRTGKPQPGERSGGRMSDYLSSSGIDIDKLKTAIAADGKTQGITWLGNTPESTLKAPKGSYIVALVVDNKDQVQDYHWYRHNPDGSWSGKSGSLPATDKDAAGKLILDPQTANRNYGSFGPNQELNYVKFIGYYAVTPGAAVGPKP
jgi:hypothetical protein